jgi:hypothetical protein
MEQAAPGDDPIDAFKRRINWTAADDKDAACTGWSLLYFAAACDEAATRALLATSSSLYGFASLERCFYCAVRETDGALLVEPGSNPLHVALACAPLLGTAEALLDATADMKQAVDANQATSIVRAHASQHVDAEKAQLLPTAGYGHRHTASAINRVLALGVSDHAESMRLLLGTGAPLQRMTVHLAACGPAVHTAAPGGRESERICTSDHASPAAAWGRRERTRAS